MKILTSHRVLGLIVAAPLGFVMPVYSQTAIRFTDVTNVAGVALPGFTTESVAWGDYDGDGDEDLYLTNDGPNRLFRNDGEGRFVDVTSLAGVGNSAFCVGAAFGDLDNDGDLDLYAVNFARGLDALYRNEGPVGTSGSHLFTDITLQAGTTAERNSRGVTLLDFNQDGLLVAAVCVRSFFQGLQNEAIYPCSRVPSRAPHLAALARSGWREYGTRC